MVKWTIKRGNAVYAVLVQDEESFRIEHLSKWAKNDDFQNQVKNTFQKVFHPLEGIQRIKATSDKYRIDLWLSSWVQERHKDGQMALEVVAEGIEWRELLGPDRPGVLY